MQVRLGIGTRLDHCGSHVFHEVMPTLAVAAAVLFKVQ